MLAQGTPEERVGYKQMNLLEFDESMTDANMPCRKRRGALFEPPAGGARHWHSWG